MNNRGAFSLVEVVLALGVCAMGLLAVAGLLPLSLKISRESIEMSQKSRLIQRVSHDLLQSRFDELVAICNSPDGRKEWAYDVDGVELTSLADNRTHFRVTATLVRSVLLPGAASELGNIIRARLMISTPADAAAPANPADAVVVTIPYTGYGDMP